MGVHFSFRADTDYRVLPLWISLICPSSILYAKIRISLWFAPQVVWMLYVKLGRSGKVRVSNSRNKIRQTCAPRLLAEPCMYTFIMPFHTTLPWHVILVHSFTLERLYGERKRVCVQSSKSNSNPTKRELLQCGSLRSAYYISPIQVGRLSIYDVRIELWSEVRHRYRGHPKRP